MSSPFTSFNPRIVPSWSSVGSPAEPSTFVPYNPFGVYLLDQGYGSGGYGDLPYGEGVKVEFTYTTDWTVYVVR